MSKFMLIFPAAYSYSTNAINLLFCTLIIIFENIPCYEYKLSSLPSQSIYQLRTRVSSQWPALALVTTQSCASAYRLNRGGPLLRLPALPLAWATKEFRLVHSTVQKAKELLIVLGVILKLRWPVFLCETTAGAASLFPIFSSPFPYLLPHLQAVMKSICSSIPEEVSELADLPA